MIKEIFSLEGKFETARKDVDSANRAAEKVTNSSVKRIEDIIIAHDPDRYYSC